MISLNKDLLFAKGSERACYLHPMDNNLCIKIRFNKKRRVDENTREYNYAKKMNFNIYKVPASLPIEWVETSVGRGLVFPLIKDYTGEISKTVLFSYREGLISEYNLNLLYLTFKKKMITQGVSVTDPTPQNIVIKRISEEESELILIDGLGISNIITIPYLTKRQIDRRISRCFEKLFKYG